EIYQIYSDAGFPNIPPDLVFAGAGASPTDLYAIFDGNSMACPQPSPEGVKSFMAHALGNAAIWWGLVDTDGAVPIPNNTPRDLSRFAIYGEMRFWIYSPTADINIQIKDGG